MRFSITWQNEDCSGEPWTTEYNGHLQNIDEVNAYTVVLKNQLNMQHSGPRVRILTVQVLDEVSNETVGQSDLRITGCDGDYCQEC